MADGGPPAGTDWIAVDWGTTALRAWAIGRNGAVLTRAADQSGMGRLMPADYEPALLTLIGRWLPAKAVPPVPVVICGMAGARQGWCEAAYRAVPCAPVGGELTAVATADRRIAVSIVPGLSQSVPADVMRGEETQLAGLAGRLGAADATVCLPGTHSKWVRLAGGRVTGFRTFMTGEMFSILATHSVLRHSVAPEGDDDPAFFAGLDEMLDRPQTLTAALFGVRAASLLEGLHPAAARSRLSGLLIGAELAATRDRWNGESVHVVGAGPLAAAYAAALSHAGARPVEEDAEALTVAGLALAHAELGRAGA